MKNPPLERRGEGGVMRPRIKLTTAQIVNRKKRIELGELKIVTFNKDVKFPRRLKRRFGS